MKIQCNACEVAEASVVCCADEAALCWACDEKVHAANKLASKHQRVPLSNSSSSHMPKCDICQETGGYFFCLEDRALLCWRCDVAIHTANAYVSSHQRFLLTGVKVGLEPTEPVIFSSKDKSNSTQKNTDMPSRSLSKKGSPMSSSGDNNEARSSQVSGSGGLPIKVSFSGAMPGIIPEWPMEETLGLTDFSQNYGFFEMGSSKTDCSKLEDTEWSPIHQAAAAAGEVDLNECLSQVPEIPMGVSEIPSPPTASGLHWPRSFQDSCFVDNSMSVPDLCSLPSKHRNQSSSFKRQRHSEEVPMGSWV